MSKGNTEIISNLEHTHPLYSEIAFRLYSSSSSESLPSLSGAISISSSSLILLQSCNLHTGVQGNPLSIHGQLPTLHILTHLHDISESTMSGAGGPVIHSMPICPSLLTIHPCPSAASGIVGEFSRHRLQMAAW